MSFLPVIFFLCAYVISLDRDWELEHMIYSFKKHSLVNPAHYLLSSFLLNFASVIHSVWTYQRAAVEAPVGRNAEQLMYWGNSGNTFCFWPSSNQPVPRSAPRSRMVLSWTCFPLGQWPWKAVYRARSFLNLLFSSQFSFFFLTLFSMSALCLFSQAASWGLLLRGAGTSWAYSLWSVFREEPCKRLKGENCFLFPP